MQASTKAKIPNAITLSRAGLSLGLFVLLALYDREKPAAWLHVANGLFIVASLTDFVDGYLARKWGVVSQFGRIADPFVDKILVLGTFAYLAGPTLGPVSGVGPTVVVILLARELLVTALRSVLEGQGRQFGADWSGKLKMVLQCLAVPLALLTAAADDSSGEKLLQILVWIRDITIWGTVVVTVLSGLHYLRKAIGR